jgi:methanogenic corrinoid protein MtbC1
MKESLDSYADRLFEAMLSARRDTAAAVLDAALAAGLDKLVLLDHVLDPALRRIGELWGERRVSMAQTYVGSSIAKDFLARCLPEGKESRGPAKGTMVIGNIEDDFHSMGRNLVVAFLQAANWRVVDLGNDVPATAFVDAAEQHAARFIGASAMMHSTALNIARVRDELERRSLAGRHILVAGGAVFNWRPELVAQVGAVATAPNAALVDGMLCALAAEYPEAQL